MTPWPPPTRGISPVGSALIVLLLLTTVSMAHIPGGGRTGEDGHHHHHHHHHHHEGESELSHWVQAFLATGAISLFPTLVLPFIPLTRDDKNGGGVTINEGLQKTLLAFAAGGLLGEVFLHCIPHLLDEAHDHHHDGSAPEPGHGHHEHDKATLQVSLYIVMGFLAFFFAEKLVKLWLPEDDVTGGAEGGAMNGHHHREEAEADTSKDSKAAGTSTWSSPSSSSGAGMTTRGQKKRQQQQQQQQQVSAGEAPTKSSQKHHHHHHHHHGALGSLKASGYLNIVVDLLHNFTDGIAIGTSYSVYNSTGRGQMAWATTISVFFHEIPHEIGDFAILVQSGLSMAHAIRTQFMTAVGAFIGTGLGLLSTRHEGLDKGLLSLTTGGFLYIATVSVIPELLSGPTRPLQTCLEFLAILTGIAIMGAVAAHE